MGQARAIALHYSPGNLISAVHGMDARGGRYMFEIKSKGLVREVDVDARTGKPQTVHVLRLAADPSASPTPRNQRPDGSVRR